MGKYKRAEAVPKAQLTFPTMQLFNYCKDKNKVWNAVISYFDWARQKEVTGDEPESPQFTDIDKDCFERIKEELGTYIDNYWVMVEGNTARRQAGLTGGRPAVDQRSTNKSSIKSINKISNKSLNNQSIYQKKPTLEEVAEEVKKQGYLVDEAEFWNHYEERGWTDKDGEMIRSWKKLLKEWNNNNGNELPL